MGSLTLPSRIRTTLYIDGRAREGDGVIEVVDPADPSVIVGTAAAGTVQDATDAVLAAAAAFGEWSRMTPQERATRIAAAMSCLDEHRDEDARVLTLENGKPFSESWVDFLVLGIRTAEALEHVDAVDEERVLLGPR